MRRALWTLPIADGLEELERCEREFARGCRNSFVLRENQTSTRLIRQWDGQTHQVTVAEEGFEYKGERYRILSEIARLITGTRWSGPLFSV